MLVVSAPASGLASALALALALALASASAGNPADRPPSQGSITVAKLPTPFSKSSKSSKPDTSAQDGEAQMKAGMMLQKMLTKGGAPAMPKKAPAPTPAGGYKSGMSGQQYAGDAGIDPTKMRPKLATKDKILNPVRTAVGLSHLNKSPKMVPKKPGK
jgi:hypothetical protein